MNLLKKVLQVPAARISRVEQSWPLASSLPRLAPFLTRMANRIPDLPFGGKSLITDIRDLPAGLPAVPGLISNIAEIPRVTPEIETPGVEPAAEKVVEALPTRGSL